MKKNFDAPLKQFALPVGLVGIALLVLGSPSCSKSKTSTDVPTPESVKQAATDHMPVYSATPAAIAPAPVVTATGEPDLGELNRSLLRWVLRNRRKPANFEEFAASPGIAIPAAPAGKKYVIGKDMHIQLVAR